jgi:TRAP transporter TAXI family solute receptor
MKTKIAIFLIAGFLTHAVIDSLPTKLNAAEVFVTIGGGDVSGVYFPTGLAIAKTINDRRPAYGIRASVEATEGSTFNLNAIIAGYMDFGMAQADKQYDAVKGLAEWARMGPQKKLRSVMSIYPEQLTLVAAVDAGIESVADLKGKKVSLGNPGSSQHRMVINALEAVGLDPKQDIYVENIFASNAPDLLQDNVIDAYFFTVGHPNDTVKKALSGERKARIVPISGPGIDRLVGERKFYTRMPIHVQRLYPDLAGQLDEVDTFGVMATLCTSASVAEEVVYDLVKIIFANLQDFRRQHPALAELKKQTVLYGLSAPLHPGAVKYYTEAGLLK